MNNKKIKISLIVAVIFMFCLCCTACVKGTTSAKNDSNDEYTYTAQEYTYFLNRQIDPVTNELITQIMLAKNVIDGETAEADAVQSAKASIQIIKDSFSAIKAMSPASGYENNQKEILLALEAVEKSLNELIDEYEKNSKDSSNINSLINELETQYIILTSQFNVHYK